MPPEGVPLSPSGKLLTDDEIMRLVQLFVKNGVNKVRLTGGEPLLRPNLVSLVQSISDTLAMSNNVSSDDMQSGLVGITTNGISLSRQIDGLVDAGLTGVNISFFRNKYGSVRVGPDGTGGSRIKINFVVMKGFNDDELSDFVRMADEQFGGDVDIADEGMPLERIGDGPNDTTKWWRVKTQGLEDPERKARIGFITSMSEHFCSSCNRLRITADGKIKVCLFGSNEKEVSLRDIMRNHQNEDFKLQEEELGNVIHAAVQRKTFSLGGHDSAENIAKAANNR
ncbi:hypothetical protein ACHAXR_000784, partial [Thalassiosira sp. AJA248-18]